MRESKALYDNLFPSRIIAETNIGTPKLLEASKIFLELLKAEAKKRYRNIILGLYKS